MCHPNGGWLLSVPGAPAPRPWHLRSSSGLSVLLCDQRQYVFSIPLFEELMAQWKCVAREAWGGALVGAKEEAKPAAPWIPHSQYNQSSHSSSFVL